MEEQRKDEGRHAGGVTAVVAAVIAVGLAFAGLTAYVVHDTRPTAPAASTAPEAVAPDAPIGEEMVRRRIGHRRGDQVTRRRSARHVHQHRQVPRVRTDHQDHEAPGL